MREISTLQNSGNPRRFELLDNIYQGVRHLVARFALFKYCHLHLILS